MHDAGSIKKGYVKDYFNAIADKLGIEIEFVFGFDWNDLVNEFKAGRIDVMPVFF